MFIFLIISLVFKLCFWLILTRFLWSVCLNFNQGWQKLKRLHQIPCHQCAFFTGNYYLKCTIHPQKALTEEAIDCLDLEYKYYSDKISNL